MNRLAQYLRAAAAWPRRVDLPITKAVEEAAQQLDEEANGKRIRSLDDPGLFFDGVKEVTGKLTQEQVDSVNLILNNCGDHPIGWVAYILATAWHEARFIPQEEWGKGRGKKYGKPGKYGQSQHGRGFVQLTWDFNYEWADKALDLNGALLRDFDLALAPHLAARILVKGMVEGAFTGKSLADYVGVMATKQQFKEARRIVNGRDKDTLIAGYAVHFQDALVKGKWR